MEGASVRPSLPPRRRLCHGKLWLDVSGCLGVRRKPRKHERQTLPLRDRERGGHLGIVASDRCRGAKTELVRPHDGGEVVTLTTEPGNAGAVGGTDHEIHTHGNDATPAHDDTHKVGSVVAKWQTVDYCDVTFWSMKIGLEDQRVVAVATADVRLPYRSDLPA